MKDYQYIDFCLDLLTDIKIKYAVSIINKSGEELRKISSFYNAVLGTILNKIYEYAQGINND